MKTRRFFLLLLASAALLFAPPSFAGSKSDYLENALLNHVLGGGDYTRPATVYVALYTVAPTDSGGGTEVSGGSYARVSVTNNGTNWPSAASGAKSNGTAFTFTTATGSWGTVVAWGLFDASSGGNLLWHGTLTVNKTVTTNDIFQFPVGAIDLTED